MEYGFADNTLMFYLVTQNNALLNIKWSFKIYYFVQFFLCYYIKELFINFKIYGSGTTTELWNLYANLRSRGMRAV